MSLVNVGFLRNVLYNLFLFLIGIFEAGDSQGFFVL